VKIKKFVAPTMKEALEMVKAEMGPEAFVLSSKQIEQPGALGIGTKTMLQVVAAYDEAPVEQETKVELDKKATSQTKQKRKVASNNTEQDFSKAIGSITEALKQNNLLYDNKGRFATKEEEQFTKPQTSAHSFEDAEPVSFSYQLRPIKKELMEIKNMISGINKGGSSTVSPSEKSVKRELEEVKTLLKTFIHSASPVSSDNLPSDFLDIYHQLLDNDFDREIAANLVMTAYKRKKKDPTAIMSARQFVREIIKESLLISGPVQLNKKKTKIMAVFGPTGVGKTTTIAKLAAYSTLNLQMKVALITMDTFRLAAVEQLSKFAEILEAPINIALNAADLHNAISFHKDRSLILIDTPGMSHRDSEKMNELKELMEKEEEIERHLAISVTTKQKDIEEIISKFSIFNPSNIIFTKLDESSTYGNIYNQMVKSGIPVSYVTNGQNVPDDIEIARRDTLTDLLLPE